MGMYNLPSRATIPSKQTTKLLNQFLSSFVALPSIIIFASLRVTSSTLNLLLKSLTRASLWVGGLRAPKSLVSNVEEMIVIAKRAMERAWSFVKKVAEGWLTQRLFMSRR